MAASPIPTKMVRIQRVSHHFVAIFPLQKPSHVLLSLIRTFLLKMPWAINRTPTASIKPSPQISSRRARPYCEMNVQFKEMIVVDHASW